MSFTFNGLTYYRIGCNAAYLLNEDIRVFDSWSSKNLHDAKKWDLALHPDGTVCVTAEFFIRLAQDYFKVLSGRLRYIGKLFYAGVDNWVPTFVPLPGLRHSMQLALPQQLKNRKSPAKKQRVNGKRKKMFN